MKCQQWALLAIVGMAPYLRLETLAGYFPRGLSEGLRGGFRGLSIKMNPSKAGGRGFGSACRASRQHNHSSYRPMSLRAPRDHRKQTKDRISSRRTLLVTKKQSMSIKINPEKAIWRCIWKDLICISTTWSSKSTSRSLSQGGEIIMLWKSMAIWVFVRIMVMSKEIGNSPNMHRMGTWVHQLLHNRTMEYNPAIKIMCNNN